MAAKVLPVLLTIFVVVTTSTATSIGSRIVQGNEAEDGDFPWMAAIYSSNAERTIFCGGALISDRFVLTSGNCAAQSTSFRVALGSSSLSGIDPSRVTIETDSVTLHPNYGSTTNSSDLALIDLIQHVEVNDRIQPIEIEFDIYVTGTKLVHFTGFGESEAGSGQLSQRLRYINLFSVSQDDCSGYYGYLDANVICAVSLAILQGPCAGDLGGGLFYFEDAVPVLVGISSFITSDGCTGSYPAGFNRLNFDGDWIKEVTGLL